MDEGLMEILGAGGRLAEVTPGFEERPQQLAMAGRVLGALRHDGYVMVEAGTGTGKTLAYLAPALLSGKKVVISTATKTLQDQIYFKDIPLLAKALGREIPAAYMKGRANYLCKMRFDEFQQAPQFPTRDEAAHWPVIESWAASTETGDRAELSLPENFGTWRNLSSTGETCIGQRCPQWETCHVTEMRRKAQEARIVVVNHHLFFADLALRTRGDEAGVEIIPRYDAVIFDEAHALEEVATHHFGTQVSTYRLQELGGDARRALDDHESLRPLFEPLISTVEERAAGFFSTLEEVTGLLSPRWGRRDAVIRIGADSLDGVVREQEELLVALARLAEAASDEEDAPKLDAIGRRCRTIGGEIAFLTEVEEGSSFVHFAERRGRGLFLRAAPIEIADELAERLWSSLPTAVFTSATLVVGGSFSYLKRRLGLEGREGFDEVEVGTPFDYRTQSAMYLPSHLPEPQDPSYVEHLAWELEKVIDLTGGRAFALFTSVRNMMRAWEILEPRLPYRVLLQGQLPKAQLVEKFQEEPSVLFATASFWEGVDVPGEALSLVAIDRLPFASPGDPVVGARIDSLRQRGMEPFGAYQVPQAAITLRQGFGRLIRSREDRGIVAIFDKRIVTKGYGRQFLRTLPDAPKFQKLEHVARWWDGGARAPGEPSPRARPQ